MWVHSRQTFADIYLTLCREKEAQKGKTLSQSPILTRAGCHALIEDYRLYMLLDLGYKVSSVASNLRRLHQAFRRAMSSVCFGSISTGTRTASNNGGSSEHMYA